MFTNSDTNLTNFINLTISILVISFFSGIITFLITTISSVSPILVFMFLVSIFISIQITNELFDERISFIEFIGWIMVSGILIGLISLIIALIFL